MSEFATWIIIPVHNRKDTTITCLRLLVEQGVTNWARVLVVDDGSTDGTADAARGLVPDITILRGSGNLWWGGAMRLGMEHAYHKGAEHLIWLNDDCQPSKGAIGKLLQVSKERGAVTVAPCVLKETGELHYGGQVRTPMGLQRLDVSPGQVIPCESMNGNCVCIPRAVVEAIGFVDADAFPHVYGDSDYALRANAAGYKVLLIGDATCVSTFGTDKGRQSWLTGEASVPELWAQCLRPQSGPLARCGWLFRLRWWGFFGVLDYAWFGLRLTLVSVIRMVLPISLIRRLVGGRSQAQARVEASRRFETGAS